MQKITDYTHLLISSHLEKGDYCVDATCGNGYDTLFLASLVGETGRVDAYDIQEQAINNAKELTKEYHNITFYHASHENIVINNCHCVLFNLGFLPHGDKAITTKKDTTLKAIQNLMDQYPTNPDLQIYLVVYPGHEEGYLEHLALSSYLESLDSKKYLVTKMIPFNQNNSPYLFIIQQKKSSI